MQYSTVAIRLLAIEDVLTGPEHMHREMGSKLAQIRELRAEYPDAVSAAELDAFPPPRRKPPEAVKSSTTPTNKFNLMTKAGAGTVRQFRRPRAGAMKRPQMGLPYQDAGWWVLAGMDSALVSNAEGTSASWYKRDPRLFRSIGRRSLRLHRRLRRQWPKLAAQYRAAAADFNSPERWRETFAASLNPPPDGP
jgi:galactofuranosylgalactofuranosylrhamnosyl-N-acetylglucosaminyl-diphospho-decaprenol beta-1,5/1,6-galactofuranosyltransferase